MKIDIGKLFLAIVVVMVAFGLVMVIPSIFPADHMVFVGSLDNVTAIEDSKYFSIKSVTSLSEGYIIFYSHGDIFFWDKDEFQKEKERLGLDGH